MRPEGAGPGPKNTAAVSSPTTDDEIRLQVVTPGGLAEEAAPHGLEAEELRHIPETPEHIATQVVIFRG